MTNEEILEKCMEFISEIEEKQNELFPNFENVRDYLINDEKIDLNEVDINNWQDKSSSVNAHRHSIVSIQARLEELYAITSRDLLKMEVILFSDRKSELPTKPVKEDKLHFSITYLSLLHDAKNRYEDLLRMTAKKKEQYDDMHWGVQNLIKMWDLRARIQ